MVNLLCQNRGREEGLKAFLFVRRTGMRGSGRRVFESSLRSEGGSKQTNVPLANARNLLTHSVPRE